jgi:hypothetical protein
MVNYCIFNYASYGKVLTYKYQIAIIDWLNEAFSLSNNSPLDSFQLFYEELHSSKVFINRIRRSRRMADQTN